MPYEEDANGVELELIEPVKQFFKQNPNPTDDEFHAWAEGQGYDVHEAEEAAYRLATMQVGSSECGSVKRQEKTGGRDKPDEDFDPDQLAMGVKIEMEHTDDKEEAKMIAKDHLVEIPDYYTRLKKMEDEAKIGKEVVRDDTKNAAGGDMYMDADDNQYECGGKKLTVAEYLAGKSRLFREGRTYISNPSEAPKGANIKRGKRGGYYYEEPAGEKPAGTKSTEDPDQEEIDIIHQYWTAGDDTAKRKINDYLDSKGAQYINDLSTTDKRKLVQKLQGGMPYEDPAEQEESLSVSEYLSGKSPLFRITEARTYIKDPSQAPKGANVKKGARGGYYYDDAGGAGSDPLDDIDSLADDEKKALADAAQKALKDPKTSDAGKKKAADVLDQLGGGDDKIDSASVKKWGKSADEMSDTELGKALDWLNNIESKRGGNDETAQLRDEIWPEIERRGLFGFGKPASEPASEPSQATNADIGKKVIVRKDFDALASDEPLEIVKVNDQGVSLKKPDGSVSWVAHGGYDKQSYKRREMKIAGDKLDLDIKKAKDGEYHWFDKNGADYGVGHPATGQPAYQARDNMDKAAQLGGGKEMTVAQYLSKAGFNNQVAKTTTSGEGLVVYSEGRIYIKDPSQAPKGANIKRGARGGFYYEEPAGGKRGAGGGIGSGTDAPAKKDSKPSDDGDTNNEVNQLQKDYAMAAKMGDVKTLNTIWDRLSGLLPQDNIDEGELDNLHDDLIYAIKSGDKKSAGEIFQRLSGLGFLDDGSDSGEGDDAAYEKEIDDKIIDFAKAVLKDTGELPMPDEVIDYIDDTEGGLDVLGLDEDYVAKILDNIGGSDSGESSDTPRRDNVDMDKISSADYGKLVDDEIMDIANKMPDASDEEIYDAWYSWMKKVMPEDLEGLGGVDGDYVNELRTDTKQGNFRDYKSWYPEPEE